MPFSALRKRALEILEPRREAYHSAVATAVDEVRSLLEAQKAPEESRGERAAAQLGSFAAGRIDTERFASLFSEQEKLDDDAIQRIEEALTTLGELMEAGNDLYVTRVRSGSDLRDAVRDALARSGRAFAAGRSVERARTGNKGVDHADGFSPALWNRAERTVAPPLVVELDGADFCPAGLADYLEGSQALVLLVKKPAPPAALARLVCPGTLVIQATEGDALDALATWDGPAVVAIVPEGAATFTYRPEDGGDLTVTSVPEEDPRAIGTLSAARQEAELALLKLFEDAGTEKAVAAAAAPAARDGEVKDTDKLAAWLLRQADIPDPREV